MPVLLLFFAAIIGLGALGARRRAAGMSDYFLAGRTLTLPLFVATLVPTFYGGVLGVGEFTWQSGLSNWLVMALPYYLFAGLYAALLAGRVRLSPGLTIADHLEAAYGRGSAVVAALLVFLLSSPADELLMVGTLLSHLSGWPLAATMGAAAAAACAILWRGGLRSDVWTNRLQIALMFGGFLLIIPAALRALSPEALRAALPEGHLSWTGGLPPLRIAGWWLIAVWTLVDPSFHQRCAAAQDSRTARLGILVSIVFWAAFDLMTTTAGLYSRALLPGLDRPLLAFPLLADRLLGPLARGLFYAAMASSMTAALQGGALQAAVALGKDGLGRLAGADEQRQESWARLALPATLLFSWLLALLLPSVVGLWYAVGSAVIPGLLLPMLGAYFPALRAPSAWALAASVGGFCASLVWLLLGQSDPMFPGLAASGALWIVGRQMGRRQTCPKKK